MGPGVAQWGKSMTKPHWGGGRGVVGMLVCEQMKCIQNIAHRNCTLTQMIRIIFHIFRTPGMRFEIIIPAIGLILVCEVGLDLYQDVLVHDALGNFEDLKTAQFILINEILVTWLLNFRLYYFLSMYMFILIT